MSDRPRPEIDSAAACTCGAARITVAGPVLSMFHCACTECQKASGSGHLPVALVPKQAVSVEGELRAYARPADSGATMTRYFCPVCAVSLYATSSRFEGAALLPVGLFGGGDWFSPRHVIFGRSRLPWDDLPADVPVHETYPQRG